MTINSRCFIFVYLFVFTRWLSVLKILPSGSRCIIFIFKDTNSRHIFQCIERKISKNIFILYFFIHTPPITFPPSLSDLLFAVIICIHLHLIYFIDINYTFICIIIIWCTFICNLIINEYGNYFNIKWEELCHQIVKYINKTLILKVNTLTDYSTSTKSVYF